MATPSVIRLYSLHSQRSELSKEVIHDPVLLGAEKLQANKVESPKKVLFNSRTESSEAVLGTTFRYGAHCYHLDLRRRLRM